MPSPKRKESPTPSTPQIPSKLSAKSHNPQKTTKAKKKGQLKPVTFPYRDYPLVRYPKDFTQGDMEAFMEEFPKELKALADLLKLSDANWRYRTDQNPINLLQCLVLSHKLGVYPPSDVLAKLASSSQTFLVNKGELSLDKCLNIVGRHGTRKYIKQQERKERDWIYIEHVYYLQKYFKISLEDACPLAATVYNGSNERLTPNSIQTYITTNVKWKEYKNALEFADDSYEKESKDNEENDFPGPDWAGPDAPAIAKIYFLVQFPSNLLPFHITENSEFKDLPDLKRQVQKSIEWQPGSPVVRIPIPGCFTTIPIRQDEDDVKEQRR
ncbi:MAG: hypothetical protein O7B35_12070 [Deltaproteobacteria bacterium]|nr:hypothetical protein [Deltaproteobacteria bacterium]